MTGAAITLIVSMTMCAAAYSAHKIGYALLNESDIAKQK